MGCLHFFATTNHKTSWKLNKSQEKRRRGEKERKQGEERRYKTRRVNKGGTRRAAAIDPEKDKETLSF